MLLHRYAHHFRRHLVLAAGLLVPGIHMALTETSSATTLWNQSISLRSGTVIADQEFPDFEPASIFTVSDVVFDSAVRIDEVSLTFTDQFGDWPTGAAEAILNIFPVDTALDTEDVTSGSQVPITIAPHPYIVAQTVTATDLSIKLHAGSYWIGLTPILEAELYGQEYHFRAGRAIGQPSYVSNPGEFFDHDSLWIPASDIGADVQDLAITVSGSEIDSASVPEPSAVIALLALQGLLIARRRRS